MPYLSHNFSEIFFMTGARPYIWDMEKTYHVYEIMNLMGTVEYVGITVDLSSRKSSHFKTKPNKINRHGKFYNRQDCIFYVVLTTKNEKYATTKEIRLQKYWKLDIKESVNRDWKRPKSNDLPSGVYLTNYKKNPYYSQYSIKGKRIYLGVFKTPEEASEAYQKALAELKSVHKTN